eukprot:3262104-Rhodomonas_salina.1
MPHPRARRRRGGGARGWTWRGWRSWSRARAEGLLSGSIAHPSVSTWLSRAGNRLGFIGGRSHVFAILRKQPRSGLVARHLGQKPVAEACNCAAGRKQRKRRIRRLAIRCRNVAGQRVPRTLPLDHGPDHQRLREATTWRGGRKRGKEFG